MFIVLALKDLRLDNTFVKKIVNARLKINKVNKCI